MSKDEITKLYSDFVYDEDIINGDPFASRGYTKDDAHKMIKDNLGIDMDNIKAKQVQIKEKDSFSIISTFNRKKVCCLFYVILQIQMECQMKRIMFFRIQH